MFHKKFRHQLSILILFVIIALAFVLRLYKLNTPLADWHSWRQVDTASVAVEYQKHGIDLLHPKYLDLSNIPSGLENPQGYRMVEFPIIPALVALLPKMLPLHITFRLVNIILSLFSVSLIYFITSHFTRKMTGLIAASIFAFLPYNVFYSRTTLPEIALVTFSLATIYFFIKYTNSGYLPFAISFMLFAILSFLLKPTAIFFFIPLIIYLISLKGIKEIFKPIYLISLFLILTSFLSWRWWIGHYPEGVPAFTWLLNGNGIRFKGSFFHWIFAKRIGELILGFWGLIPLGLGISYLMSKTYHLRSKIYLYSWLLSMLAYLIIFATGNVQHDYYQIILIPIISIFVAIGTQQLLSQKNITSYVLLVTCYAFTAAFSWYSVRGFYNINNGAMVKAGKATDEKTEQDALIIAPYNGDTAFLYQTNRRGWPIGGNIDQRIQQGADYYVTTALDTEAQDLLKKYPILDATPDYTIIKLSP